MAAASVPTLRSSRRVAGLQAPVEQSTREKLQHNGIVKALPTDASSQVLQIKAEPTFEMPPRKKQRVEAPHEKAPLRESSSSMKTTGRRAQDARGQNHVNASPSGSHRELKDLQPLVKSERVVEEKRQLRSHGGASRIKSELALFFPCYDEVISNEPKQPEFWSTDMSLLVVDDESNRPVIKARPSAPAAYKVTPSHNPPGHSNGTSTAPLQRSFPVVSPTNIHPKLHNTQLVDFSSVVKHITPPQSDPMEDSVYTKAHRRAERREKQLRNIEKNKAQHEKTHLERLLEGLKGPDWLKIMGISGITDSEKKDYEEKRDYFIDEVTALLEKFKAWKEEERRRKLAKDQALQTIDNANGADETSQQPSVTEAEVEADVDDGLSDGDPPDYSDVDAWAARQLHQEAVRARGGHMPTRPTRETPPLAPRERIEQPVKPFTSFYSKPYLRAAAIGKHRRSGRSARAFGCPLPDVPEMDFKLPSNILTAEVRIASARRCRRLKRGSKDLKGTTLD